MTENEEFEKWFEENKKWLYSMDYMQAAYHAWRGGVSYQQAAQQSVQRTCANCGSSSLPIIDAAKNKSCAECGASR